MLRLSKIRIGTKLALISGLSVVLVAAMMGTQMLGNAAVRNASENAIRQAALTQTAFDIKASLRGLQISVRDVRIANSPDDLEKAKATLAERQKGAVQLIERATQLSRKAETTERLKGLIVTIGKYVAAGQKIAAINKEMIDIQARRPENDSGTSPAAVRIATLDYQASDIARQEAVPMAEQMEALISSTANTVQTAMNTSAVAATEEMTSSERIGLAVGAAVVLALIGSAVFGFISIGKPLRKMAGVLVDLTNDRIVDVPYTNRGDEVGDIAKATEVFKQSIAEKVINLRVRSGLDVVRSNVMVADGDYNIMYMNTTLQEMMQEAEPEIRKALPNFDGRQAARHQHGRVPQEPRPSAQTAGFADRHTRISHHDRQPEIPSGGDAGHRRSTASAPARSWSGATRPSKKRSRPRSTAWSRPRSPAISPSAFRSKARKSSCSISPRR